MKSAVARTLDGTITITIDLLWNEVKTAYERMVDAVLLQVEIKGFRKGKAPKDLALKQLDKNKVYEEALKELLPNVYSEAVTLHKLRPFISPEIQLIKAKENEDWQLTAKTCEKPSVDLHNYHETVQKAKGELKKDTIWIPGKDAKKEELKPEEKRQKELNAILAALYKSAKVTIPIVLLQTEVNRRLARLVDELAKLGMTLEQYLTSKGKTADALRRDHEDEVVKMYSVEFILEELADREKIIVEPADIDKVINASSDPKEKESLAANRYYIASMLRRQKTLDKLAGL